MLCEWRIHKKGAFPTIFCLKINHGGAFTPPLKIRYKGGKEPKNDLDNGIKKLSSDQDVLQMLKYVEKYKVIDLYVDPSITKESLNVDESLLVNELDNDLFIGNQELGNNDEDVIEDKVICKSDGPLTPNASKVLNKIMKEAGQLKDMAANGEETAIPESYCHQVHWLSTWKDMYRFKVNPCNGPDFWEKSTVPTTIIPPKINPQIGRPPKKGRRVLLNWLKELLRELLRVTSLYAERGNKSITCGKYKGIGHYQRKCPNDAYTQTATQTQQSSQAPTATQASQTGHTTPFHPSQLHASPTKLTKATTRRMSST
ncbi:hypothetical protein Tco_1176808 [Tanacetum coccineum]